MLKIVELILSLYIIIFPTVAYTFLRMSSKQLLSILSFSLLSYVLVGLSDGFSTGILMLTFGTIIQIIIVTAAYVFCFRKELIKFNQPLFKKDDTLKTLVKIFKEYIIDKK